MFALHQFFVVAALSGAVFQFPAFASELDEYHALKDALVRSKAKKDRPLPRWIKAEEYEPRPHYWLTLKVPQVEALQPTPALTDNEKSR